jgi:hypothetical protein
LRIEGSSNVILSLGGDDKVEKEKYCEQKFIPRTADGNIGLYIRVLYEQLKYDSLSSPRAIF